MHILIDECLPRELGDELIGHEVTTVQEAGWAGFKNGQLLKKISGSFETFITIDKRIESEHEIPGDVALITVRAPSFLVLFRSAEELSHETDFQGQGSAGISAGTEL